jgi:hypothetical protein
VISVSQKNQSVEGKSRKVFPVPTGKILLAACALISLEGCQSASVSASNGPNSNPAAPNAVAAPASSTAGTPVAANVSAEERPTPVVVPTGSVLRVRVDRELNTKYSRPGDRFTGVLESPVVAGRTVVLSKGTVVGGHVLTARPSGRLKGRAVLAITLDTCRVSGREIAVSTSPLTRVSGTHRKRNWALIGGGSGTGGLVGGLVAGPVGLLAGAASGAVAGTAGAVLTGKKEVTLPAESVAGFTLRSPLTVQVNGRAKFQG